MSTCEISTRNPYDTTPGNGPPSKPKLQPSISIVILPGGQPQQVIHCLHYLFYLFTHYRPAPVGDPTRHTTAIPNPERHLASPREVSPFRLSQCPYQISNITRTISPALPDNPSPRFRVSLRESQGWAGRKEGHASTLPFPRICLFSGLPFRLYWARYLALSWLGHGEYF